MNITLFVVVILLAPICPMTCASLGRTCTVLLPVSMAKKGGDDHTLVLHGTVVNATERYVYHNCTLKFITLAKNPEFSIQIA